MSGRYSFARKPGWIAGHLIVLALFVTTVLLGNWQLTVSEAKHFSLQNFGYALQWWIFAVFGVVLWFRILRDQANRGTPEAQAEAVRAAETASSEPEPVAYRRYVMPQSSKIPARPADPEQAAYNDYLAQLHARAADERTTQ